MLRPTHYPQNYSSIMWTSLHATRVLYLIYTHRVVRGVQEHTCTQSTGSVHWARGMYTDWVTSFGWWSVWRHWVTTTIHIHMQSLFRLYSSRRTNYPGRVGKLALHNTCRLSLLLQIDQLLLLLTPFMYPAWINFEFASSCFLGLFLCALDCFQLES